MNLYTSASSIESHRTRIVLCEKDIVHEINIVDPKKLPEDLIDLNPYGSLPTLVDRDLVLYNSRVIMEYLEERFPHPPLMPVGPVQFSPRCHIFLAKTFLWSMRVSRRSCGVYVTMELSCQRKLKLLTLMLNEFLSVKVLS